MDRLVHFSAIASSRSSEAIGASDTVFLLAKENDTPVTIAKEHDCEPQSIIALNVPTIGKLRVHSKLKLRTEVQLPTAHTAHDAHSEALALLATAAAKEDEVDTVDGIRIVGRKRKHGEGQRRGQTDDEGQVGRRKEKPAAESQRPVEGRVLATELHTLSQLHDKGALSKEQYDAAVDLTLSTFPR